VTVDQQQNNSNYNPGSLYFPGESFFIGETVILAFIGVFGATILSYEVFDFGKNCLFAF